VRIRVYGAKNGAGNEGWGFDLETKEKKRRDGCRSKCEQRGETGGGGARLVIFLFNVLSYRSESVFGGSWKSKQFLHFISVFIFVGVSLVLFQFS
jgi:hypothetical protein